MVNDLLVYLLWEITYILNILYLYSELFSSFSLELLRCLDVVEVLLVLKIIICITFAFVILYLFKRNQILHSIICWHFWISIFRCIVKQFMHCLLWESILIYWLYWNVQTCTLALTTITIRRGQNEFANYSLLVSELLTSFKLMAEVSMWKFQKTT